jgi:biopolymer transport protein TolR
MIKNYFSGGLDKDLNSESLKTLKFNKNDDNPLNFPGDSKEFRYCKPKNHNKAKKKFESVTINIIPLIDVLLVLLIIFMMTAETINSNIEINLPEAKSQYSKNLEKDTSEEIIVFIDSKGEISLNDKKFLNLEEFENFLASSSLLKFQKINLSAEKEIIFSSDKEVHYQKIINVLVALNNAGLNKIKMAYKNS